MSLQRQITRTPGSVPLVKSTTFMRRNNQSQSRFEKRLRVLHTEIAKNR